MANDVHTDMTHDAGWTEPCGQFAIERTTVAGEPMLRIELALTSDEGDPWITGRFTASPSGDSPSLRDDLSSPTLPFATE